ncbi:MAG: hypothetical protein J0M35_01585 [Candidatus Obscuribacter phosphatis]|uniref:Uncharacterized protein n=1 Tax=Candidatus Obscuribacter phosphatis TaxID=1906157 RepID=A0A8J7P6U8_9BACT|nr:hypothetical protein [Candidatus Obscuribacter phosphatis]
MTEEKSEEKSEEKNEDSPILKIVLRKNKWLSLISGLAVGIFLHYILFRLTLPTEPFIYAAF